MLAEENVVFKDKGNVKENCFMEALVIKFSEN